MEMEYRLYQDERGLGMSGLTLEDRLVVYKGDQLVASFDCYWLLHDLEGNLKEQYICRSQDGTKVAFYALRYPAGTFPDFENYVDELEPQRVVCLLDLKTMEIKEMPYPQSSQLIYWDGDETIMFVESNPEYPEIGIPRLDVSFEDALDWYPEGLQRSAWKEFFIAHNNVNKADSANARFFNDPKRLEYYLFKYDPRYVKECAFKYCVKRRNDYLRSHGLPIPFEDDILD